MFRKIFLLITTTFFLSLPLGALAQTGNEETTSTEVEENLQQYKQAKNNEVRVQLLKTYGVKAIELRVKGMEKLQTTINASSIEEGIKSILTTDLQNNISSIKALKSKIESETDLATLKNDVHAIFVDYRIFMVVLPRDHGRLAAARLNGLVNKASSLEAKLDKLVSKLKEKNVDTTQIEELVADFKSQIQVAQGKIAEADAKLILMGPEDTETAKIYLNEAKNLLSEAKVSLQKAQEDLKQIKAAIKDLKESSPSATKSQE
ncbi:hypothetical protein CO015_02600 [candidate division WWE3 bacterium CG_4_8_14_3_um_filter_42_11]|uniref:DUF5667 domain-containing protein n=1 Tax=candidate division WWE3 bacterium CG_4_8_14_3_um_filter_42_11 TaxID=1975076 RepID=A0A2M8G6X4_UNCKA|nr:MAG: hypothetical protein CO015_02600 [candidate division WWE3 bacterium CG_4_8_14_3_um_filter_42_11]